TDQQINKKKLLKFIILLRNQYSDVERSYTYDIIKEGNYSPAICLKYTKGQKDKFQYHVKSEKLGSNAACLYAKSSFEIFEQTRNIHQQETVLKSSDNLT
ncbi:14103_t:CDS:2, partial [Rhizophagus irregularis]